MKKFETGSWIGTGLIREIDVIRETEKSVYALDSRGREMRQMKESRHQRIHETWEAAHQFLMDQQQEKVDLLRRQLERANGTLGQIKGLKKPEAA